MANELMCHCKRQSFKMKPRYYVHMGPKAAEKVSCMWKAAHIFLFLLILCSSSIATACIYNILNMYDFHCIIYAKVSFERTYEERFQMETQDEGNFTTNSTTNSTESLENDKKEGKVANSSVKLYREKRENSVETFILVQRKARMDFLKGILKNMKIPRSNDEWLHPGHSDNESDSQQTKTVNNTGFLNMRKTVFASIYMCDLMFFAPLASIIMAIFLGALIGVGGKGGAGNPGDVLPNPWICVYPFLGLCAFMMIFSFIADNIYHKGFGSFCLKYFKLTKSKSCSEKMDHYNIQFSKNQRGPPKPFYMTYFVGSYGVQLTSALWVIQSLVYVFRILCLADFSLYLTRIRMKDDDKGQDPKLANIVLKLMDSKNKLV